MKHVLVLPSYLDCKWSEGGTFFKEQAVIMHRFADWKINMLMPCARHAIKIKRRKFPKANGIEIENLDGMEIWFGYYPYYLPRKTRQAWRTFGEELFLQYIQKHGTPDLLWQQGTINAGYLARYLQQKYGIPYFMHEHARAYIRDNLSRFLCTRVRTIIDTSIYCAAVGEELRKSILRQIHPIKKQIAVIHNPVGIEFTDLPTPASPATRAPVFISISYLRPDKNVDSIIHAFAAVRAEYPNARLVIGGDGSEKQKLQSLTQTLNITNAVSFVGKLSRTEVCEQLQNADFFVGIANHETFGLALVESLACGLPAVATSTGISTQIIGKHNGALAASTTATDVADAMRVVARGTYDRAAIQKQIITMFHPRVFARRVEEVIIANYIPK